MHWESFHRKVKKSLVWWDYSMYNLVKSIRDGQILFLLIMYVVRPIIWSKSNISFSIILVQLKECQIPFYKWTKYWMYEVYLLSRSIETWISHLFFEAKKHEHEKVTQSLIAGCWFLKISNEKTNFCWILVCQVSS